MLNHRQVEGTSRAGYSLFVFRWLTSKGGMHCVDGDAAAGGAAMTLAADMTAIVHIALPHGMLVPASSPLVEQSLTSTCGSAGSTCVWRQATCRVDDTLVTAAATAITC